MAPIGVLAIQGDFLEHRNMLDSIGIESVEVRLPEQLENIDGLIIPGGESTTIVQLIDIYEMRQPLVEKVRKGLAVWGTCAGMIVIAKHLKDKRPNPLGLMDIEVSRNAFGRQIDSFETNLDINGMDGPPMHAIFIRAPLVTEIGNGVEILAEVDQGKPVAVKQNRILATSFHPELTEDPRMHTMFANIAHSMQ
ncbi:MAG: pyridoxal 5'-phosphate synthase glutaminase subunit PdxT [Dehalococcoidia bacterium]|uniref:glutaminase n=1 Tax=marine metagenome TaxID=408172 RepID=A0A381SLB0_9ZZZZ|nr:pyridoxal 5'-phosphate synthase glutaminase subunit PdxT [Chloroflexota bacterium]MBH35612.1 pyridoxal 5'-phosphate synthase glutaminase subunit PdxT [Dehalococcoidia bacterium]MCH2313008.1 pyridoxal 5'-phosphate synthase glutaminase subunit PdxT [SAR202 cluster bacterium]MCS5648222.1 pyridoxal 5'-phosphate synthase glutaminase subunit PdxT [Dehalococcoidia bacterium]MEC7914439.1 pyridoxal 5'-phosphate synthase glutaminase subunit PdxT [Chloroflexota bacterium]